MDELEQACDRYLKGLHCTLWGQSFEVISPKGREEASKWLADQIRGVGWQAWSGSEKEA